MSLDVDSVHFDRYVAIIQQVCPELNELILEEVFKVVTAPNSNKLLVASSKGNTMRKKIAAAAATAQSDLFLKEDFVHQCRTKLGLRPLPPKVVPVLPTASKPMTIIASSVRVPNLIRPPTPPVVPPPSPPVELSEEEEQEEDPPEQDNPLGPPSTFVLVMKALESTCDKLKVRMRFPPCELVRIEGQLYGIFATVRSKRPSDPSKYDNIYCYVDADSEEGQDRISPFDHPLAVRDGSGSVLTRSNCFKKAMPSTAIWVRAVAMKEGQVVNYARSVFQPIVEKEVREEIFLRVKGGRLVPFQPALETA